MCWWHIGCPRLEGGGTESPGALAGAHLGKTSHVVPHNLGVGALQLLDDLKALVELGENVHHGAGEEGVLRGLLELWEGHEVSAARVGDIWAPVRTKWPSRDKQGSRPPHCAPRPVHTPSFLSLSSAPCRKSRDTSSFSSSHWMTKGSNQLEQRALRGEPSSPGGASPPLWPRGCTHAGYSGTRLLKEGSSVTYSLYNHFTLKCRFM